MTKKLSLLQIDALKEIVSIGAGNAATALSQMLKKKVTIDVPHAELCALDEVAKVVGGAETVVNTVYLQLLGDAPGVILFTYKEGEVLRFADVMLGRAAGETKDLDEMATSALKEASSILAGAYLNSIGRFLKMQMIISSPHFVKDMVGAVIDNILIEISKEADSALILNTELKVVGEKLNTYFFFVPDGESLDKLLKAVGMNSK